MSAKKKKEEKIIIYTDGSRSNESGNSGFSYKILFPEKVVIGWGGLDGTFFKDIHIIEMIALHKALEKTVELGVSYEVKKEVYSDSESIISAVAKYKEKSNDGNNGNYKDLLLSDIAYHNIECSHVKAHTNGTDEKSKGNRLCDEFAKIGRNFGGNFCIERKRISASTDKPLITFGIRKNSGESNFVFYISIEDDSRIIEYSGIEKGRLDEITDKLYKNVKKLCTRYKIKFKKSTIIEYGCSYKIPILLEGDKIKTAKALKFQGENMDEYLLDDVLLDKICRSFDNVSKETEVKVFIKDLDFLN